MRFEWKKITTTFISCGILFGILGGLLSCDGEEPGRIHVNVSQVVGVYEAPFPNGRERLELKSDGTYVQDFISKTRPFHHTGQWHIDDHVFGGSDVILAHAFVSEVDETRPLGVGDCRLNVHNRSGKVALARNEVMDWYYQRLQ